MSNEKKPEEGEKKDDISFLDWSAFDGMSENTCVCRCQFATLKDGDTIKTFLSHTKIFRGHLVARKPCPECKSQLNLRSASSEREGFSY